MQSKPDLFSQTPLLWFKVLTQLLNNNIHLAEDTLTFQEFLPLEQVTDTKGSQTDL